MATKQINEAAEFIREAVKAGWTRAVDTYQYLPQTVRPYCITVKLRKNLGVLWAHVFVTFRPPNAETARWTVTYATESEYDHKLRSGEWSARYEVDRLKRETDFAARAAAHLAARKARAAQAI